MAAGEHVGNSKLSGKDVSEIKKLKGTMSAAAVGRRYGVYGTTVRDIWNGKTWKGSAFGGRLDFSLFMDFYPAE